MIEEHLNQLGGWDLRVSAELPQDIRDTIMDDPHGWVRIHHRRHVGDFGSPLPRPSLYQGWMRGQITVDADGAMSMRGLGLLAMANGPGSEFGKNWVPSPNFRVGLQAWITELGFTTDGLDACNWLRPVMVGSDIANIIAWRQYMGIRDWMDSEAMRLGRTLEHSVEWDNSLNEFVWRVGTAAGALGRSTPQVICMCGAFDESDYYGLDARIAREIDTTQYLTDVWAPDDTAGHQLSSQSTGRPRALGYTADLYVSSREGSVDKWGNPQGPYDTSPALALSRAGALRAQAQIADRVTITVQPRPDLRRIIGPGDKFLAYNRSIGVSGGAALQFNGHAIDPAELRCTGLRWPVLSGPDGHHGVWWIPGGGLSGAVEISDWVIPDGGDAEIFVGPPRLRSQPPVTIIGPPVLVPVPDT